MTLKRIFTDSVNIAVCGMSRDPRKAASRVPAFLAEKGYRIIPINPSAREIMGLRCYASLDEVEERIDVLEVFRPPAEVPAIAARAARRRAERGDVHVLWLQEGITSPEAASIAVEAGMDYVEDRCMLKEYLRLMG
ncbi:MAG TPA: CoA-binding protein [Deltaproteobacteria bacterium]|nr:CoA-binding protein [Deltaproteobacteria bacterium]